MDVKLWLDVLPSIVGNERNLKRVILYEVEDLFDLWDCSLL